MNIEKLKGKIRKLENTVSELQVYKNKYDKVSLSAKERTKELRCLYSIASAIVSENEIQEVLDKIIQDIPSGFQYSELTNCNIEINDSKFSSKEFSKSNFFISEKIFHKQQVVGKIEVFYSKDVPCEKNGPFLLEECDLVKGISNLLSLFLRQKSEKENRRLIQNQLLHADRLATIGQLAAGVAHELNEPLGNILGYAQLAKKGTNNLEQLCSDLNKIEESCLYSRQIIRKLLDFARQSHAAIELLNLNEEVKKSIFFLEARCIKEGIKLIKEFYTADLAISGDSGQIKQVITNLVINAIQAISNRDGIITIKTDCVDNMVILSVEDNGEGIDPENVEKIFMPFFTTKDVGAGTGLGLSVVYGIIKNYNGEIRVNSEKGIGTKFTITFPKE